MTSGQGDQDMATTGEQLSEWRLKLYVAGHTVAAERALRNLEKICRVHLPEDFTIEVIDLLENPKAAEAADIVAVPTLVRESPGSPRRIIGDLSRTDTVLSGLEIEAAG